MKNIIIRAVRPEDAEQYNKITNIVWRDAYKHIFPEEVFIERESRINEKIKTFPDIVYNGRDQFVYVAEVDGQIIGYLSGKLTSNHKPFFERGYAELLAIYFLPEYQSLGLGSKLKNMFIDWLKSNGKTKFVVAVLKDNYKARKVYEKWGGRLDEYSQPFVRLGVGYGEVFYTYDI